MKTRFILVFCLFGVITACNRMYAMSTVTPVAQPSSTGSVVTVVLTPPPPAPTQSLSLASVTPLQEGPQKSTPSTTPILKAQQNNCGQILLTFQGSNFEAFESFTDAVVINKNDFWLWSYRTLKHYQNGKTVEQISLPEEIVVHAVAFEISESGFWIYDQDRWPTPTARIRLLHMDFEGNLIAEYEIPKTLLVDKDGNYVENAFAELWWDTHGELYIGGTQGVYQLLNSEGQFEIRRAAGYDGADHVYIPLNFIGSSVNPVKVRIDDLTIPITTTSKTILLDSDFYQWGIVTVLPDNSLIVQVMEVNEPYEATDWQAGKSVVQFSLRRYSLTGDLIKNQVCITAKNINFARFYAVQGKDHQIYIILTDKEKKRAELINYIP